MALLRRGILVGALALFASGCMGHRSWSYAEDARIDAIIARGREPLEEAAARGVPVPNVPRSAQSLKQEKWVPIKKTKSKSIKLGKIGQGTKRVRTTRKSSGFRFSGL